MAKIVEAIRPNAAAKLAAERRAVADVEKEIADLRAQHEQALLQDDPTEAIKTADKLAAAERRLAVHHDRIAAFGRQGKRERNERRQQQKAEALIAFEKRLADRAARVARAKNLAEQFAATLRECEEESRTLFHEWPDVFPRLQDYYSSTGPARRLAQQFNNGQEQYWLDLPRAFEKVVEAEAHYRDFIIGCIKEEPIPALPELEDAA